MVIKNLNELAVEITRREGLKVELSIAQIKEVIRCEWDVYVSINPDLAEDLMKRHIVLAERRLRRREKNDNS